MCLRPVRWFTGVPSPVKHPEKVDMVIFRENTEDIYAGLEVEEGTPEAKKLIELLKDEFGWDIRPDSGIGIKPISETGSKRLIRAAIEYAVKRDRKSVTLVHKGNIQKFTEGAFMSWGYELVRDEFADVAVGWDDCGGKPGDKILVKDAIADITLQQVLTRPDEFDVIATTNLNGDYLSDALAAQVGGIGIAPGGNINYVTGHGVFEATHGTAPKYAGQDKVNPGSVILSGVMMFEHLGWQDAADDIVRALEATIAEKIVTYDFARLMDGATEVKYFGVRVQPSSTGCNREFPRSAAAAKIGSSMVLAELLVRHTRRHMPTRRVALVRGVPADERSGVRRGVARRGRGRAPAGSRRRAGRAAAAVPGVRRAGRAVGAAHRRCATGCRPTRTGSTCRGTGS